MVIGQVPFNVLMDVLRGSAVEGTLYGKVVWECRHRLTCLVKTSEELHIHISRWKHIEMTLIIRYGGGLSVYSVGA